MIRRAARGTLESMPSLSLVNLTVHRGGVEILRGVDLRVESGASLAVLGQSGSGKSSLLRTIVGLDPVGAGRIYLDSTDVTYKPVSRRGIGYVAQTPALQPNLTLARNVERPLEFRERDRPPESRRRRVSDYLRRFDLGGRGDKKVTESSAGEKHSAATARGSVTEPAVLLLDEPVIALDAGARRGRVRQLRLQHEATESTLVVATNDWTVAAGLADHVAVLGGGTIAQHDESGHVYDGPNSLEVAELTGRWPLNRLGGTVRRPPGARTEIITPAGTLHTWRSVPAQSMIVGIRPADLIIDDTGGLTGVVRSSAVLGRTSLVMIDAEGLPLQAMGPTPAPPAGTEVRMEWRRAHLFTLDGKAVDHLSPDDDPLA